MNFEKSVVYRCGIMNELWWFNPTRAQVLYRCRARGVYPLKDCGAHSHAHPHPTSNLQHYPDSKYTTPNTLSSNTIHT
ncbi:hypothetical protein BDZ94DRAFT_1266953 [Collybia nuda]|uniref:Uncharacterized protein n=1 Tax=Collybia nuda TaxID=64659 RepID=A0A9P5Y0J8_9AGAR|nr:hypothetical protein BDZ94DRAFT_1266953 [Collybia nuda]